ncbi:DNA damage-inducible transcript 4-like protein [Paramisgurnus dabryanus]|uniref:DNA damage-inducible transcript 4-like protein n=1 Tax=Paramisgurnus dabryanus TaxID=90735 RepID=UPI0031F337D1
MVYTQALLFANGMSRKTEQQNLAKSLRFRNFGSHNDPCGRLMKAESLSSLGSQCSLVEEESDEACLQLDLSKRIEKCLSDAKKSSLRCQELRLPRCMTERVAGDILRASEDEPCGIRGALIHVFLDNKGELQKLGTVTADECLTPTFELSLILQADKDGWPPLKILFGSGKNVLSLRREYRLIKRKLYSSATPIVLEFY